MTVAFLASGMSAAMLLQQEPLASLGQTLLGSRAKSLLGSSESLAGFWARAAAHVLFECCVLAMTLYGVWRTEGALVEEARTLLGGRPHAD